MTTTHHQFDVAELKTAAASRWPEIIATVGGIAPALLDGKHHPCPKCGGTDRFRLLDAAAGAVFCNMCFSESNGDGLAAIQWLCGCSFPESLRLVAEQVGIAPSSGNGKPAEIDIVDRVAQIKKMPLESYRAFGAKAAMRGKMPVSRVPVYNELGEAFSYFDLTTDADCKGWFKKAEKKGDGTSGVFLADGRKPQVSDSVVISEGFKDSCVWLSMGFNVVGLPADRLDMKHARLFRGCHVFVAMDRNEAGEKAAKEIAPALYGVAATVHVVTLPTSFETKGGDDARDIYHKRDGEKLLRQAIEDAVLWEPEKVARDKPIGRLSNFEMVRTCDAGGKEKEARQSITMPKLLENLRASSDNWPRRIGSALFVHDGLNVSWLGNSPAMFGWAGSAIGKVEWAEGAGFVTKPEMYAEVQRTATDYDSVEDLPRIPPLPRT